MSLIENYLEIKEFITLLQKKMLEKKSAEKVS